MKLNKKNQFENILYMIIALKICGIPILGEISRLSSPSTSNLIDIILNVTLVVCLVIVFTNNNYLFLKPIGGILLLGFILSYCYFVFPQYNYVFDEYIYQFLVLGSLGYICGIAIKDPKKLLKNFYIISLLSLFFLFYQPFLNDFSQIGMTYGYKVLISTSIILLYTKLYKKTKFYYLIVGYFFLSRIFFSSRGALLLLIIYTLILLFINNKLYDKIRNLYFALFTFIFFIIFSNKVVELLANLSSNFSSRTIISKIGDSVLFSGNGRNYIHDIYWKLIDENLLKGVGIGVDRLLTGEVFPHNIYIELMAHYGVILGHILLLFTVIILCKGLSKKSSIYIRHLVLVLLFSFFLRLLFSNTYLNLMFPIMFTLGLCNWKSQIKREIMRR